VDEYSPTRRSTDYSHERDDTGSSRDVTDPSNEMDVAWTSSGGGVIIAEISPLLTIYSWQIQKTS
jgi:hypothetical protein